MPASEKSAVIVIGDGCATAMAGGPISLAELGPRTTKRASHLEFANVTNEWCVLNAEKTTILFHDPDYDVALKWEVDHFNRLLSAVG